MMQNGVFLGLMEIIAISYSSADRKNTSHLASTTYFISRFEALSLDTTCSVWVDCDAWLLLRSEHIIDLANEHLVLRPDHTGKQGHCIALDHANDLALTNVRDLSDDVKALGWARVVATTYIKYVS